MKNYHLIAKTFSGLEPVLASEINEIGGKNIKIGKRAVFYEGNLEIIYKSNYFLRSALRILKEIKKFQYNSADQFYLQCKKIDWSKYMDTDQDFAINSLVAQSKDFRNSMFASLKAKDAIADYFRQHSGQRPNVNTKNPDIVINIHIYKNTCTVSLDSSGESLHKRGYRVIQGDAPLNEVLAAAMILLSGWDGKTDFIDPMCGSGTLPIEAVMIAQNIPAGKFRKEYAFTNWKNFDRELFENVIHSGQKRGFSGKIYASDISKSNLLNAITNARRALVYNKINFQVCDFRDLKIPVKDATLIMNPPYGERLKPDNLSQIYQMIGERLKHQFSGNNAWILSNSKENFKHIGLKPSQKKELYNGSIKCSYNKYEIFSGKRKVHIKEE